MNIEFIDHFFASLLFTLGQSFLSAFFSLVIGFFGALGLIHFSTPRSEKIIKSLVLLPNVLPTLIVIICVLNVFVSFLEFPFGFWGIVLLHVLLNLGLLSLGIAETIKSRLGGALELCWIEGAKFAQVLPLVIRQLWPDLKPLFYFTFCFCFTSFSVPLMVGRGNIGTLEVLIYEQVRIYGDLQSAWVLSLAQLVFLGILALWFFPKRVSGRQETRNLSLLSRVWVRPLVLLPSAIIFLGLLGSSFSKQWTMEFSFLLQNILERLLPSLGVALLTGLLLVALLFFFVFLFLNRGSPRILFSVSAPSTVVIGLSLFSMGEPSEFLSLKVAFGLSLLFVAPLYRWVLAGELESLKNQLVSARVLGASQASIFFHVLWPQVSERIRLAGQLACLWAVGDFALSSVVAPTSFTLALLIKDLVASYYLDSATILCFFLLGLGVLALGIFGGFFRVIDFWARQRLRRL